MRPTTSPLVTPVLPLCLNIRFKLFKMTFNLKENPENKCDVLSRTMNIIIIFIQPIIIKFPDILLILKFPEGNFSVFPATTILGKITEYII